MSEITHRFIETNGIRMHLAECGTGPLVVLCHGFPESWYSWRHQLHALAEAGFHAVAPDMRGYGQTDRPEPLDRYTLLHTVGDVVGLLDGFGHRDRGDRRTRLGRTRRVVLRAFAARSLSRRDRFERAVQTAISRSSYQHYAPNRGRAILSAVLSIPWNRRGGARARCSSEHSQLPLLGFRGRPG